MLARDGFSFKNKQTNKQLMHFMVDGKHLLQTNFDVISRATH